MVLWRRVVERWRNLYPARFEDWQERAAIMEHLGGLPREDAEHEAFECISRALEPVSGGVTGGG